MIVISENITHMRIFAGFHQGDASSSSTIRKCYYATFRERLRNILVSTVIPGHNHQTFLTTYVIVDFEMAITVLATLKISESD